MLGVSGLIVVGGYFIMQNRAEAPSDVKTEVDGWEVGAEVEGTNLQGPNGEVGFEVEPIVYKKPPQEAIDACKGRKEGDTCSVVAPNGTLPGKCLTSGQYLSCVPN